MTLLRNSRLPLALAIVGALCAVVGSVAHADDVEAFHGDITPGSALPSDLLVLVAICAGLALLVHALAGARFALGVAGLCGAALLAAAVLEQVGTDPCRTDQPYPGCVDLLLGEITSWELWLTAIGGLAVTLGSGLVLWTGRILEQGRRAA